MGSTDDKVHGTGNEAVGNVKQVAGQATGDGKLEAEGKAQQAKGEAQQALGKAKEAIGDALKNAGDALKGSGH